MVLEHKDKIASGAYADIFRPPHCGLVYKLFVSGQHHTNASQGLDGPEHDEQRRRTFASECKAYARAAYDPFLRNHIPRSFHRCTVADVRDCAGSVADRYMLTHCYAMEYIVGVATKLVEFPIECRPDHIAKALETFRALGIDHIIDSSIFSPDDPESFRFIDFAVEEFQVSW